MPFFRFFIRHAPLSRARQLRTHGAAIATTHCTQLFPTVFGAVHRNRNHFRPRGQALAHRRSHGRRLAGRGRGEQCVAHRMCRACVAAGCSVSAHIPYPPCVFVCCACTLYHCCAGAAYQTLAATAAAIGSLSDEVNVRTKPVDGAEQLTATVAAADAVRVTCLARLCVPSLQHRSRVALLCDCLLGSGLCV